MNHVNDSLNNIYAIVVGIEKYQTSSDLDGAVKNALNFAKWLRDKNVSSQNILLFISALDKNKQLVDDYKNTYELTIQEANNKNIYDAFYLKMTKNQGDLLYIFWAGHGYLINVDIHKLVFFEENTFDLTSLIKHLKTIRFRGFNKQVIMIDACATHNSSVSSDSKEYNVNEYKDPQQSVEQFILKATQPGKTAKYKDGKGLFSDALFTELQGKENLVFPEEMKEIKDGVIKIFEDKYKNVRNPIYLWFQDEYENQEKIGLTQLAQDDIFLNERWEELKTILLNINQYSLYIGCHLVLSEYCENISGSYPRLNSLKNKYTNQQEIPDIIKAVLFNPTNNNKEQKIIFILIKFVSYLIVMSEGNIREELTQWNRQTSNLLAQNNINSELLKQEITNNLKNIKEQYENYIPYLIIICQPKFSNNENKILLSAELVFQIDNNEPKFRSFLAEDIECSDKLTDIQEQLDDFNALIIKILRVYGFQNQQLTIEMFLHNDKLILSPQKSYEKIAIKIDTQDNRKWISCQYKFILRSLTRIEDIYEGFLDLETIKQEWNRLYPSNPQQNINDYQFDRIIFPVKSSKKNQTANNKIRIKLLHTKNIFKQNNLIEKINNFLQTQIIHQGLPLFIWVICDCDQPEILINKVINELLVEENLTNLQNLLESIRQTRVNYCEQDEEQLDHLGYSLGFLCDNPYRLPGQYNAIGTYGLTNFGF